LARWVVEALTASVANWSGSFVSSFPPGFTAERLEKEKPPFPGGGFLAFFGSSKNGPAASSPTGELELRQKNEGSLV
jgi:hypothetical protein